MILKPPLNPKAIDLIKSCTDRYEALDQIRPLVVDGVKMCAWCHSIKVKGIKYCGPDCSLSAQATFYPQKEESLFYLLVRQDFKCAVCQYDYIPLVNQLLINGRVYDKPDDFKAKYSYWLMKRIKSKSPKEHKPEVDHINPVYKGNSALSVGLEGVWCLCYKCHKTKTSKDLSGPRKKILTNEPS